MSDTKYYLAKPGTKEVQGPLTVAEICTALADGSVTGDYVYCAKDMKEWKSLGSLPGLEVNTPAVDPTPTAPAAPAPVAPIPTRPTPAAAAPTRPDPMAAARVTIQQPVLMVKPPTYMVSAILVTILCCLPFGVVAIIKASQVDALWYAGRYEEARQASASALLWYRLSFWSVTGPFIIYLIIILFSFALG